MNYFIILFAIGTIICSVISQENAQLKVSNSLVECYNNSFTVTRDNQLPHNIHAFIAILRKIEDDPELNMDLLGLSVALLHRFRQDGIVESPGFQNLPGVIPYAGDPDQTAKYAQILRMIPGDALTFPNDSITLMERCTLHFMLSSSIDMKERGDESSTCNRLQSGQYRKIRAPKEPPKELDRIKSDVEMLTDEELETKKMNSNDNNKSKEEFPPNTHYPAYPPNHPLNAQYRQPVPNSKCPLGNGVIHTNWGTATAGSLLAGIAAALKPYSAPISELIIKNKQLFADTLKDRLDNKWLATLAGDLAEVAIIQVNGMKIGLDGHWNSSLYPKYYFLDDNEFTQFTAAEVRGDLDALILATYVDNWYKQINTLKLSQIFDMYYSDRGVFNTSIRACNRQTLLTYVAPNETASIQAYLASAVLEPYLSKVSIDDPKVLQDFAIRAVNELFKFVPSSLQNMPCPNVNELGKYNHLTTDLLIFIDTNWDYKSIHSILTFLLENMEINKFASNFTLLNAFNGDVMINSSNTILDFYNNFNETLYRTLSTKRGLDLPKITDLLIEQKLNQLHKEWEKKFSGGRSDTVLIISSASVSDTDKNYYLERMKKIHEILPDVNIFFLTTGSRDKFADLAVDEANDIFITDTTPVANNNTRLNSLIARLKQVPRRLINSQCGANYTASGMSEAYSNYIEPAGINYYRIHPNYFFHPNSDSKATIKIQGHGGAQFTVCNSRSPINSTVPTQMECTSGETHSIQFTCQDAAYIHTCNPLYLSIATNSSTSSINTCPEPKLCRYPDMQKYTISFENLVCVSAASSKVLSQILVIVAVIYIYIQ